MPRQAGIFSRIGCIIYRCTVNHTRSLARRDPKVTQAQAAGYALIEAIRVNGQSLVVQVAAPTFTVIRAPGGGPLR